ncbi:hypothetical protein ACLMJK_006191 [Lecanora helva]
MSYNFLDGAIHVVAGNEMNIKDGTSVDIIALHGIGGEWDATWTLVISMSYPSILRVLATDPVDVVGLILDLMVERRESERTENPIVCIGHSFGGTILKQIYVTTHPSNSSNPDFHQLNRLLRGYVYLGTPHKDVFTPDFSKLWRALGAEAATSMGGKSADLEKALTATSRINRIFETLGGEDLPTMCFYETERTFVGTTKMHIVTQKEATFSGRPVESIPLDVRHQSLGKYSHNRDSNLRRILSKLEGFMTIAQGPESRKTESETKGQRRLKLLSLDGGGVKGFFTILVIKRLIDETRRMEGNPNSGKRPCDYFDLIGGTSTGGLLAIMLGRLQMDASSCIVAYRSLSKDVFYQNPLLGRLSVIKTIGSVALGVSWFSGDLLKSAVCQTVESYVDASERESLADGGFQIEDLRFASIKPQRTCCFVCAVPAKQRKVERLRSYRSIDPSARNTGSYTIWEAARATSAAPLYFPPIKVQGNEYFDGGLDSNNPVVEVIEEARQEFPGALIETVVSIGTGKGTIPDPVPPISNILNHFINRSTDTEVQHERVMKEPVFEDVRGGYFRFQGETDLGEIDLSDAKKLDEIEELANKYLDSSAGRHMIASCAARLAPT